MRTTSNRLKGFLMLGPVRIKIERELPRIPNIPTRTYKKEALSLYNSIIQKSRKLFPNNKGKLKNANLVELDLIVNLCSFDRFNFDFFWVKLISGNESYQQHPLQPVLTSGSNDGIFFGLKTGGPGSNGL